MMKPILILTMLSLILIGVVNADLYNTTNVTNANNIYEQVVAINALTDHILGLGIIIMSFVITFVVVQGYSDTLAAFGAASFFGLLSATILLPLNMIGFPIYRTVALLLGVSVFLSVLIRNKTTG